MKCFTLLQFEANWINFVVRAFSVVFSFSINCSLTEWWNYSVLQRNSVSLTTTPTEASKWSFFCLGEMSWPLLYPWHWVTGSSDWNLPLRFQSPNSNNREEVNHRKLYFFITYLTQCPGNAQLVWAICIYLLNFNNWGWKNIKIWNEPGFYFFFFFFNNNRLQFLFTKIYIYISYMNKVDSLCVNDSPVFQVHLYPLVQEDPVFLDFPCHPEEKKVYH